MSGFSMKEIKGSIEIDAPVGIVWGVLTDFGSYPEWNPFIVSMIGEPKLGSGLDVTIKSTKGKETKFKSKVAKVEENKELLLDSTVIKGMLKDMHQFVLEPLGPEKTRFSQSIVFKGMMQPLVGGTIKDAQISLEQMNQAAKERCGANRKV
jgi:hypothetical protein